MSGYVYFIQGKRCRLIKIGYSDDPNVRLRSLQLGSPDLLTLLAVKHGDIDHERELHAKFAKARQHGEWFKPTKRLLTFIANVLATHDQTIRPYVRPSSRPIQAASPVAQPSTPPILPKILREAQRIQANGGMVGPVSKRPYSFEDIVTHLMLGERLRARAATAPAAADLARGEGAGR